MNNLDNAMNVSAMTGGTKTGSVQADKNRKGGMYLLTMTGSCDGERMMAASVIGLLQLRCDDACEKKKFMYIPVVHARCRFYNEESIVTVNRSPHGNKTARDQFAHVDTFVVLKIWGRQHYLEQIAVRLKDDALTWGTTWMSTTITFRSAY